MISIILIIAAPLVLLIFLPYHIAFTFKKTPETDTFSLEFRWTGFALKALFENNGSSFCMIFFSKRVDLPHRWFIKKEKSVKQNVPPVTRSVQPEKGQEKKTAGFQALKKYLVFVKPGGGFLKNLYRTFEFEKIDIDVDYGSKDPSITGKVYGWYRAFYPFRTLSEKLVTHFTPEFQKEIFAIRGEVVIRFWVSRILHATLVFGFQALREWLHRKWVWIPKPVYK